MSTILLKSTVQVLTSLVLAGLLAGCGSAVNNPVTGQAERSVMSEAAEIAEGKKSHTQVLQEYGVWNKVLFGTDYPFTTVAASLAGMRSLNDMLEGTRLPRLNMDKMEQMFARDTLGVLGISA